MTKRVCNVEVRSQKSGIRSQKSEFFWTGLTGYFEDSLGAKILKEDILVTDCADLRGFFVFGFLHRGLGGLRGHRVFFGQECLEARNPAFGCSVRLIARKGLENDFVLGWESVFLTQETLGALKTEKSIC